MSTYEIPQEPAPAAMPLLAAAELQDSLLIAANDLDRLQRLIDDAAESLMGSFYGASGLLKHLLRDASRHPEVDEAQLHQAMQHMAQAVTALQFQDMSSQLISHVLRRLHHCADLMAKNVMGDDEDGFTVVEPLPLAPNPVTQDEVDAGSIELF